MNSRAVAALVLAVSAAVLAVVLQPSQSPEPEEAQPFTGQVFATVAGEPLYIDQAESRFAGLATIHGDSTGKAWQEELLDSLVDDIIIRQQASAQGAQISPLGLALGLSSVTAGQTPEQLETFLKASKATYETLTYRVYINLLAAKVFTRVTEDATVSDDKVHRYFEKHREQYAEPNDDIAFAQAEPTIRQELLFEEQKSVYDEWLSGHRDDPGYEVDVTLPNWWKTLSASGADAPATDAEAERSP